MKGEWGGGGCTKGWIKGAGGGGWGVVREASLGLLRCGGAYTLDLDMLAAVVVGGRGREISSSVTEAFFCTCQGGGEAAGAFGSSEGQGVLSMSIGVAVSCEEGGGTREGGKGTGGWGGREVSWVCKRGEWVEAFRG